MDFDEPICLLLGAISCLLCSILLFERFSTRELLLERRRFDLRMESFLFVFYAMFMRELSPKTLDWLIGSSINEFPP